MVICIEGQQGDNAWVGGGEDFMEFYSILFNSLFPLPVIKCIIFLSYELTEGCGLGRWDLTASPLLLNEKLGLGNDTLLIETLQGLPSPQSQSCNSCAWSLRTSDAPELCHNHPCQTDCLSPGFHQLSR